MPRRGKGKGYWKRKDVPMLKPENNLIQLYLWLSGKGRKSPEGMEIKQKMNEEKNRNQPLLKTI